MARKAEELALEIFESDFVAGSKLVQKLSRGDQERFKRIMEQLKADTRSELTETEYFSLGKRLFFCETIEQSMQLVGIDNVPKEVLALYDRVQESVTQVMRRYREGQIATNSSIDHLKKVMMEVVGDSGTLKLEFNQSKVIDVNAVQAGTSEDDKADRS